MNSGNQNVVAFQPAVENYGERSLTAADVRAQVNLMQDVMQEVMQDGVHYGTIPGTKSKSLWKSGAEKLMMTFRLAGEPDVEDLSKNGEIHYRVKVRLTSAGGMFIGTGIGECNSQEEKYAWRAAVCDEEWDETPDNRRRTKFAKWQNKVEKKKQVRTNPSDVANTILKMAKKRAQVDAVITATAAGDIFTQDIEDLPDEVAAEIAGQHRSRSAAGAAAVQSIVPPDSPERDEAKREAEQVASLGVEAFRKMWAAWAKERRALVADLLPRFQRIAESAAAVEVEGE